MARPNVIVILTDDQGYGDLSYTGNPVLRTPALDRLQAESVRFTDFHVCPVCTPTRGELMTGCDALRNGATFVCMGRSLMRADLPTAADIFAANGYRTGLFGKWHLGDNYPYRPQDRGFQEAIWHPSWGITSAADVYGNDYFDDTYRHRGEMEEFRGYCTDVWFEQATAWMRRCASARDPFFAYIATNAPHGPLWVPDHYRDPYRGAVADGSVTADHASFYAMIACIDENLARLDWFLHQNGLYDDTIVLFMTDNGTASGEAVYNAGMRGKKSSLYDGGHRVPCLLRWPGGGIGGLRTGAAMPAREAPTGGSDPVARARAAAEAAGRLAAAYGAPAGAGEAASSGGGATGVAASRTGNGTPSAGRDVTGVSRATDVLPTLVDLCGLRVDDGVAFDGVSLAGVARGTEAALPDRMTVVQYGHPNEAPAFGRTGKDVASVLWGRWRLVNGGELYDIAADPGQAHDVAAAHPGVAARMRDHYEAWWDGVGGNLDQYQPLTIGAAEENPMRLCSADWAWAYADNQRNIRGPVLDSGTWHVQAAHAGTYSFTLRRWPEESGLGIAAEAPPLEGVDGGWPAGRAIPAASAWLRAGASDATLPVPEGATEVTFRMPLDVGPAQIQSWWLDAGGRQLAGAYYLTAERLT